MIDLSEQTIVDQLVERLTRRYPKVAAGTVDEVVNQNYARFDGRPVRDYIPLLVERRAKQQLASMS